STCSLFADAPAPRPSDVSGAEQAPIALESITVPNATALPPRNALRDMLFVLADSLLKLRFMRTPPRSVLFDRWGRPLRQPHCRKAKKWVQKTKQGNRTLWKT
ncbi:MAG: hypothetical protein E6760_12930, partial [Eggerthella sp.]|nr:hypothetical protein [Eggerthella sp.]